MKRFYILLFSVFLFGAVDAQNTIVSINRNNIAGPTATGVAENITAIGFTRGSGLQQAGGQTGFNSKRWNVDTEAQAIAGNKYVQWSVTGNTNFIVNISSLNIRLQRNHQGPPNFRIYYSLNGFSVAGTPISTVQNLPNTSISTFTYNNLNINSSPGGTVTFRLYAWDANNNGGQLSIEGNTAWSAFGIANPGAILGGTVAFNGLVYSNGIWTPNAPSISTGALNAWMKDGSYSINDEVHIQDFLINPTNGANLSIKKDGSLIVNGNITTSNSLTLESDSDEYSSLIVNGTITGNASYNRHVNITSQNGGTNNNDLISAPVTGQAFNVFSAANPNIVSNSSNTLFLFGPFDKSTGTYVTYSNTETAPLAPAIGYRAASTDNGNFLFTGTVNIGSVSTRILHTGPQFTEWNLIGNPYPSYIKLADFLAANNAQFDPDSSGVYGYDGFAADGWTVWNLAYSQANPDAKMTPGQGFLVASLPGGGMISFTPNMRSIGNTDDFIVGRNVTSKDDISLIRIHLSNGSNTSSADIYLTENATLGLDAGYDSSVFGKQASSFGIYSHLVEENNGIDMAIQSLPFAIIDSEFTIPLGVNTNNNQQLSLSIEKSTLPENVQVILIDHFTNKSINLMERDYSLVSNSSENGTERFSIALQKNFVAETENSADNLHIYATSNSKRLIIEGQLPINTNVEILNLMGRVIKSAALSSDTNYNEVDVSLLPSGIYVVKVSGMNVSKSAKIVIK